MTAISALTGPKLEPADGPPDSAVVLLHGYGADGNDLIGLGKAWQPNLPRTVFLSPHAPEAMSAPEFGGRQWFPITFQDPTEFTRGAVAAAPVLQQYLDEVLAHYRLKPERLALVGFSQGCMMALHVGLRRPASLAAILGYSGALAGAERLMFELTSRAPIKLIHGMADELVPVQMMHFSHAALAAAGLHVLTETRPGLGHGIDEGGMQAGAAFLVQHLPTAAEGV